jgi:hypothetical protein
MPRGRKPKRKGLPGNLISKSNVEDPIPTSCTTGEFDPEIVYYREIYAGGEVREGSLGTLIS